MDGTPAAGRKPMLNPLRSEAEMFRLLLYVLVVFVVIVAVVVIVHAA